MVDAINTIDKLVKAIPIMETMVSIRNEAFLSEDIKNINDILVLHGKEILEKGSKHYKIRLHNWHDDDLYNRFLPDFIICYYEHYKSLWHSGYEVHIKIETKAYSEKRATDDKDIERLLKESFSDLEEKKELQNHYENMNKAMKPVLENWLKKHNYKSLWHGAFDIKEKEKTNAS